MVEAVQQILTIERACCRVEADHRFSARAMTDAYDTVYGCLLSRRTSS
jgi:hypothetical protein